MLSCAPGPRVLKIFLPLLHIIFARVVGSIEFIGERVACHRPPTRWPHRDRHTRELSSYGKQHRELLGIVVKHDLAQLPAAFHSMHEHILQVVDSFFVVVALDFKGKLQRQQTRKDAELGFAINSPLKVCPVFRGHSEMGS